MVPRNSIEDGLEEMRWMHALGGKSLPAASCGILPSLKKKKKSSSYGILPNLKKKPFSASYGILPNLKKKKFSASYDILPNLKKNIFCVLRYPPRPEKKLIFATREGCSSSNTRR